MTKIDVLPEGVVFVANGQEGGVTWTRLTDGDGQDYMTLYDVEAKLETFYVID